MITKKYVLQHVGHPMTGMQSIDESDWKTLSTHASASAAFKKIAAYRAPLASGTWNDHYRVIGPDGKVVDYQRWLDEQAIARSEREYQRAK
mgnify:CR=1 FL=1